MSKEERTLLESWKEISAYLKRSVRTCRRWEESLDLPIHRLDGTPSARVFAYPVELDRWLKEKLHHAEEDEKKEAARRGRKLWPFIVGAACLAVFAGAVTLVWRPFSPAPAPLPRNPSLAVLPFENQVGDIILGPWRTALPDLIITDLVQSRYVNVVRITDLLRKLVELKLADVDRFSDADLKTVAENLDVEYVVTGTLTRDGPDKTLTVLVRSPRAPNPGRPIRVSFRAEKDAFAAVDALTPQIKRSLGLTRRHVSRDIDHPVSGVSTASPQAFKLFSQGYRLAGLAKFPESIALLKKAVGMDPEFALAYKYLYRACLAANRQEDERAYIRKSVDLSGRLSDRERGELEVLFYGSYETDAAKELESLERLARTYPEDRFGSTHLLGYYIRHEEWERALPVAERAWPANRSDVTLCRQLAICYANLGQWDRAVGVLTEFVNLNPGHTYWRDAVWLRSGALRRLGKFDEALADVDRLIAQFPNQRGYVLDRGIVLLYNHDFAAAEREFRKLLAEKEPSLKIQALMYLRDFYLIRGRVEEAAKQLRLAFEIMAEADPDGHTMASRRAALHLDMAYLLRLTGRPAEALEEVQAARQLCEKSSRGSIPLLGVLPLEALILLDLDRMEDFEKRAEEVKALIEEQRTPKQMRIYDHLLGHGEMKKGGYEKAVAHFSRALDLAPMAGNSQLSGADPEYWHSLALAHAQIERLYRSNRALVMYQKVCLPSTNWLHNGDLYARSFYEMARYHEAEADYSGQSVEGVKIHKTEAIQLYSQFLDLWDGADPIFALQVEDARKRLAALGRR